MATLVVEALQEAGRPLTLGELEDAVKAAGYQHAFEPKNSGQLRASISALPHKSTRIRRVGPGLYDVSRQPAAGSSPAVRKRRPRPPSSKA